MVSWQHTSDTGVVVLENVAYLHSCHERRRECVVVWIEMGDFSIRATNWQLDNTNRRDRRGRTPRRATAGAALQCLPQGPSGCARRAGAGEFLSAAGGFVPAPAICASPYRRPLASHLLSRHGCRACGLLVYYAATPRVLPVPVGAVETIPSLTPPCCFASG